MSKDGNSQYSHLTKDNLIETIHSEIDGTTIHNIKMWFDNLEEPDKKHILALVDEIRGQNGSEVLHLENIMNDFAKPMYENLLTNINSIDNDIIKQKLLDLVQRDYTYVATKWAEAISLAIQANALSTVKALLDFYPTRTYQPTSIDLTCLNSLVEQNDHSITEFLIQQPQVSEDTFLKDAISENKEGLALHLIEKTPTELLSVKPTDWNISNQPLVEALKTKNYNIANALINKMDPDVLLDPYQSIVVYYTSKDDSHESLKTAQILIEKLKDNLNNTEEVNVNGNIPLRVALVNYKNSDTGKAIAKMLIKYLTIENYDHIVYSMRLASYVIEHKQYDLIAEMLANAAGKEESEVSELLTALHNGVANGEITTGKAAEYAKKIPDFIFENEPYINILISGKPDAIGKKPNLNLLIASDSNKASAKASELIKELTPSQLIKQDAQGNTALHYAVIHNKPELVSKLLDKLSPAQADRKNNEGKSAVRIAFEEGKQAIFDLFTGKYAKNKEIKKNLIRAYITALKTESEHEGLILKRLTASTNTKLSKKAEKALKDLIDEGESKKNIKAVEDAIAPFRFNLPQLPWKKKRGAQRS